MWTILEIPPQPFGECSICRKHNCGEYEKDGIKKQMWIHTPIEMDKGGSLVFGYQCVKSMSDNLGVSKEFVEHEIFLTPTDEQIGDYVRSAITLQSQKDYMDGKHYEDHDTHVKLLKTNEIRAMDKPMLKEWFTERQIPFVPQWGEERLREEALKHL